MHHSPSGSGLASEEVARGVAVEKLDSVKKWGINTYKVGVGDAARGWRGYISVSVQVWFDLLFDHYAPPPHTPLPCVQIKASSRKNIF